MSSILKGVNPWFWAEVPNILRAYFSVKKTLVLSFADVLFLKRSLFRQQKGYFTTVVKFAYFKRG